MNGFINRNPYISVRKAEARSLNRVSDFNNGDMTLFCDKLGELKEKYKFLPNNSYNADEVGVTTVIDPRRVLPKKAKE